MKLNNRNFSEIVGPTISKKSYCLVPKGYVLCEKEGPNRQKNEGVYLLLLSQKGPTGGV